MLPRSVPEGPPVRRLPPLRTLPLDASLGAGPVEQAMAAGIPVWEIGPTSEAGGVLEALEPDLLCTACFPRRVPASWRERPPIGAVNLHPSLLPRWRGPAPLFWQLRAGAAIGVTLHRLTERFDAGPVLAQRGLALPEGASTDAVDRLAAQAAAALLAEALEQPALPPGHEQDEGSATQQSWPGAAERRIPREWGARQAFNFVRGAARWGPFTVDADDGPLTVAQTPGWYPDGAAPPPEEPRERRVRFADGVLRVRVGGAGD